MIEGGSSIKEIRKPWGTQDIIKVEPTEKTGESRIRFETGSLTHDELEAILNALPIGFDFVDSNDNFIYFNRKKQFPLATLGRKTQRCHPPSTVPALNQILGYFKKGHRNPLKIYGPDREGRLSVGWWIPVLAKNGHYLGTLDVDLDVTDVVRNEVGRRDELLMKVPNDETLERYESSPDRSSSQGEGLRKHMDRS